MTSATSGASVPYQPELLGHTLVCIGGSAGLGLDTARRARAEEPEVILTGRNPAWLKEVAPEDRAQRSTSFDATNYGEAAASARPVQQGHLVRLGRPAPTSDKAVGLYRPDAPTQFDSLLGAVPMHDWRQITVTPLEPHANDPGRRV